MKTIGMIGGMSWESSVEYYRLVNHLVKERLGGFHSAHCLLYSVDFAEVEALQMAGDWQTAGEMLAEAAHRLELGGAEILILCTNTMHRVAEIIQTRISIPFLHIADATAQRVRAAEMTRIGLLGTRFTMEQAFYRGRLEEKYGLDVIVPDEEARQRVHDVIYQELCQGIIRDESRRKYLDIIANLKKDGAQGVILGCTEIGLLVKAEDSPLPIFDTTLIHAQAAVEASLN